MADSTPEYRQRATAAATTVLLALSIVVYGLRIFARYLSHARLQIDDFLMGAGLLFSWGVAISIYIGIANGMGQHDKTLVTAQRKNILIVIFVLEKLWSISFCLIKCSIICLYMRIFCTRTFRIVGISLITFSICWALAAVIGNTFQCLPPAYFYDRTISGVCGNSHPFFIAIGTLSFVGDVAILIAPLPLIWNLSMDTRKKIVVTGILLLGAFVCVISALRITTFSKFSVKDVSYTNLLPAMWSYIEIATASICGSLPLLKTIFGRFLGLVSSASRSRFASREHHSGTFKMSSSSRDAHYRQEFDRSDSRENILDNSGINKQANTALKRCQSDDIELGRGDHHHITVRTDIRQDVDDFPSGHSPHIV